MNVIIVLSFLIKIQTDARLSKSFLFKHGKASVSFSDRICPLCFVLIGASLRNKLESALKTSHEESSPMSYHVRVTGRKLTATFY